jgi:hypothetical protein
VVQRTVSCCEDTRIIGQGVQVGLRYAGQIVTIEESTKRPFGSTIMRVPDQDRSRTSRKEVTRHTAYRHTIDRKIG